MAQRRPRAGLGWSDLDGRLQIGLGRLEQRLGFRRIGLEGEQPAPVAELTAELEGVRVLRVYRNPGVGELRACRDPGLGGERVQPDQARAAEGHPAATQDGLDPFGVEGRGCGVDRIRALEVPRSPPAAVLLGDQRLGLVAGLLRLLHQDPGLRIGCALSLLTQLDFLAKPLPNEPRHLLHQAVLDGCDVGRRLLEAGPLEIGAARRVHQTHGHSDAIAGPLDVSLDQGAHVERLGHAVAR